MARVLTEKEIQRVEKVEEITRKNEEKGYTRTDVTVSIIYANMMALILSIPFILVFGVLFFLRGSFSLEFSAGKSLVFFLVFIAFIPIHELIHGLTWGLLSPNKFKTIEFGFMKELLTPYCTCAEPMGKFGYMLGAFMPCFILGIIPCTYSVFTGSFFWLIMGILMIMSAGGDLTVILKMIKYKSESKDLFVMDHPSECGFIVFER